ncbi:MAG: pyridoxamine 5'-phosphate oxidase family protein [Rikenellaceae bacterium]
MANEIPKEIIRFIREHHVMTLASHDGDAPYCANLFYAYSSKLNGFVYTSSLATSHAQHCLKNTKAAGSIVVETKVVGKVRGLQISGNTTPVSDSELAIAKGSYLRKFPFAVVAPLELWLFRPSFLKLTDNRLGFGKKLIWEKDE